MRFLNFPFRYAGLCMCWMMLNNSCHPKTTVLQSPTHYNFAEVLSIKLDLKLQEISGLAWDSKNNVFLAVNDEAGMLYFLEKENKTILSEYKFGDNGDYEDVAVLNEIPYVLRSDGLIIRIMTDPSGKLYGVNAGKIGLSGTNDFETMYADPARGALVIICKSCKADDAESVSAFAYYPDSGIDNKPLYTIDASRVKELSPFKTSKFEPSGASIHPKLQKLFIVSSTSHQLVVTDLNGIVESVYKLAPSLFPQPEGIAFKQGGDMYISNEGINRKATLLKFAYDDPADREAQQVKKAGYNFSVPDDKMVLGKPLHEISGMAYIASKNLIMAENDEKGDIFTIDFINKKDNVDKIKFGGKGDYEDIVYTDTAIYLLISSGTIVQVQAKDTVLNTREFELPVEGKHEFETLYLDADGHSLIMLCKDCAKEKEKIRAAYRFDLYTNTFSSTPAFIINIDDIKKILNDDKAEFKPSAGAVNPVTGKLFLVASVGKILVIADIKGNIEQVFRLDPSIYNQPEGLTFAPNGDLYISNEGGEGSATILEFNYVK